MLRQKGLGTNFVLAFVVCVFHPGLPRSHIQQPCQNVADRRQHLKERQAFLRLKQCLVFSPAIWIVTPPSRRCRYKLIFPIRLGLVAGLTPLMAPWLNPFLISIGLGKMLTF